MNLLDTQSELFFWQEWYLLFVYLYLLVFFLVIWKFLTALHCCLFVSADYLWILNRDPSQFLKHIGFAQWIYATVRLVYNMS